MRVLVFSLVVLAAGAAPAFAQMIDGAPGSVGGLFGGRRAVDPNRTSQTLSADLDFAGGYDRDPNALVLGASADNPSRSWPIATAAVGGRYRVGYLRRSLEARGRGNVNYQGNTHLPLSGGQASVSGMSKLGRRALDQFVFDVLASYEPGLAFGAINPVIPQAVGVAPLDVVPELGIIEERWFVTSGTAQYQHYWRPHLQSSAQFGAGRVRPVSGTSDMTSKWQSATVSQSWTVRPGIDVIGSYRYARSEQLSSALPATPALYQVVDGGFRYSRRLSSIRRYSVSFAGGVARLHRLTDAPQSEPLTPSFSADFEFIPSRTWNVRMRATHGLQVMAGVSPTPMRNDNVEISLDGSIGRRLRMSVSGNYLDGTSASPQREPSETTAVGGSMGLRYALSRMFGVFGTYTYYHHRLQGAALSTLPPLYDRYSARVGVTMWLPLYGAF